MFRIQPAALAVSLALSAFVASAPAAAAEPARASPATSPAELDAVVVTANPLGSTLFDLVPPAAVMQEPGLTLGKRHTLGETLNALPGMSSTYFGPNASRPVIRGLDSDRIRILQNGTGSLDASALSFDHATAIDPMNLERIEVVRGAAALLYGGNAVGGVVNVIDNRIARTPVQGVKGSVELRHGGAEGERSGGARVDAGNGRFVLHLDAFARDTSTLEIRGPAVSDRLRALSTAGIRNVQAALLNARSRLPNSDSRAQGGGIGATAFFDAGSAGLSYSAFDTNYGTVAEPTVRVDMKSGRWDLAGELADLPGFFSGVKGAWAKTNYDHNEVNGGVVGTLFRNKGADSRIEATHRPVGPLTGSIGAQWSQSDFSALGAEAFVPNTRSDTRALFLYEEAPFGAFKLSGGARLEHASHRSDGGGNIPTGQVAPRFGTAQTRSFNATSASIGGMYTVRSGLALVANLSSTERAPTGAELYANGPHIATGVYEVGNTAFGKERANAIDLGVRWRSGHHSASVSVYRTRFSNFIAEFRTGANRAADGEVAPVDAGGGQTAAGFQILPEVAFRAVPALFQGFEAQGQWRVWDGGTTLDLELKADAVSAHNTSSGDPLPRIAPMRVGAGLMFGRGPMGARLDVLRVAGQGRVSANELPTDGYTMVNAVANYTFKVGRVAWDAFVRGNNLLNVNARNHVSFLKDHAPLPGRGVMLGVKGSF